MYSTPCSLRLFASRSAPLISAILSLLSVLSDTMGGGRRPVGDARSGPMIEECLRRQITHLSPAGSSTAHRRFRPKLNPIHDKIAARRRRSRNTCAQRVLPVILPAIIGYSPMGNTGKQAV